MPDDSKGTLTSEQAADILGVSKATVLRANRVGSLASTGTAADGDALFSLDAVELYRRRRTELFRGAVRSGAPATGAKSAPKSSPPAGPVAEAGLDPEFQQAEREPEPERQSEPATASIPASEPGPEPVARVEVRSEPVPDHEAQPAQRTARRHLAPPTTLAEISREEWLEDWNSTLQWLDQLALALSPIEGPDPTADSRAYEPRSQEPPRRESSSYEANDRQDRNEEAGAEEAVRPASQSGGGEAVNLAVRPVVSFAILKEIGLALRARPGVLEARLDRLDNGAAWFVLRHDGSVPVDGSVTSALHPLGFSANRAGDGSFEVVQDSSGHSG